MAVFAYQKPYVPAVAARLLIGLPFWALALLLSVQVFFTLPAQGQNAAADAYYTNKRPRTDDFVYEPAIRSVTFMPYSGDSVNLFGYPVTYINDVDDQLRLEFDELTATYQNYYFRLQHCNWDWTPDNLMDMEFLPDFNEFLMENYQISSGTRVAYYHYKATMPKVKITGNYLVKVYRNRNQDDVIITRRYVVYDTSLPPVPDIKFALDPELRFSRQQVDFSIPYGSMDLVNPAQMVHVVVRQNGRWDNALTTLKPMFIKEEDHSLDYHFYNCENCFAGGNEWRAFDIRSIRFNGRSVERTAFNNQKADAWLYPETTRNRPVYDRVSADINGRYFIDNFETHTGATEADYVYTHFALNLKEAPEGKLYVFGMLTDWKLDPAFELHPDSADPKKFTATPQVKQGYYNYMYALKRPGKPEPDLVAYEGSYNITENVYDILVYFRPIGSRYDQLLGYAVFDYYGNN